MKFLAAALLLAVLLLITGQSPAHFKPGTLHNREHAIVFGFCGSVKPCPLGEKALQVAYCESGPNLWPWATNGRYWGAFQFGEYARARFGFAWNIWEQSRAAYRYWRVSGWAPWSCAYIVGVL